MATYQTVTAEDTIVVVPHLDRSAASLKAAELLQVAGLLCDSVSRAQISAVHAERALLATEKRSPQDLRGVHRLATLHFLQNEQLDAAFEDRIEQLFVLGRRADWQPDRTIGAEDCSASIRTAREFHEAVVTFLKAGGYVL